MPRKQLGAILVERFGGPGESFPPAEPIRDFSETEAMQIKLITVAYDPESDSFPVEPLSEIEGEIVNVVEHFFQHNGLPKLLLIVHHRPIRESRLVTTNSLPRTTDPNVRSELSEPERELFDRLRAWRNGRAQTEGVPPYVLLTNRQLAELARRRPTTLTGLREVDGIGEAKSSRFGKDVLAVLAQAFSKSPAAVEASHVPAVS